MRRIFSQKKLKKVRNCKAHTILIFNRQKKKEFFFKTKRMSVIDFFMSINLLKLYVSKTNVSPRAVTFISICTIIAMVVTVVVYTTLYFQTTHLVYSCQTSSGLDVDNFVIDPVCECMNTTTQSYQIYSFYNSSGYNVVPDPVSGYIIYEPLSSLPVVQSVPISDCIQSIEMTTVYYNGTNLPVFVEVTSNPVKRRTMFLYNCTGTLCVLSPFYSPIYMSGLTGAVPSVIAYQEWLQIEASVPTVRCCGMIPEPITTSLLTIIGTSSGLCGLIITVFSLLTKLIFRWIKIRPNTKRTPLLNIV